MWFLFCIVACLSSVAFGKDPVFQERADLSARLNTKEAARYDRIKKSSGVLRAKLIAVNDTSFSQGTVQLEMFAGARGDFRVAKDKREDVWKGKGKNLDRFVIRKIGGKFTGHILHRGTQYVLVPIKGGVSVLIEQSNAGLQCGSKAQSEARQ